MSEAYDGPQVVGMDLHRRRSVLVRMTEDGQKLGTARITNGAAALRASRRRKLGGWLALALRETAHPACCPSPALTPAVVPGSRRT